MKPGYYTARLTDWELQFMGQTDRERPVCIIHFAVESAEEGTKELSYRGWLSEKAKAFTVKDLVTLGFKDTTLEKFAAGKAGNALDTSVTYKVKVVNEEWKGKTYAKVRGIYSTKFERQEKLDTLAKAGAIKAIDIAAEVLAARGTATPAVAPVSQGNDHDLPF